MFLPEAQARSYDIYVDADNTGTEDGSSSNPYNTITEALAVASEGDKILLKMEPTRSILPFLAM